MKLRWGILKNPKFLIGAFVLFIVVLWMLNRSSTGTGGTVTAAPAPQQDNQLALAGIAASVQNNQLAAALQATQDTNATQIALAQIGAGAQNYQTDAAAQIAALGIAEQSHTADLAAQISALGIQAQSHASDLQYQTNLATLTASVNMAQMAYDSANYAIATNDALQAHLADNQLAAYQIGTAAQLQEYQIGTIAQVTTSLVGHNKYSSIALPNFVNALNAVNNAGVNGSLS